MPPGPPESNRKIGASGPPAGRARQGTRPGPRAPVTMTGVHPPMSRLDDLPPDQRAALSLLLRNRKSYAEVASLLDHLRLPARVEGADHLESRHMWYEAISSYYRDLSEGAD